MSEKKTAAHYARIALKALEDKKARDVKIIDISQVSVLADYFIIANGASATQIQTLSDAVSQALGKEGLVTKQVEGYQNAQWVLLDFGDLIVHIFDEENRLFYDLERIWLDGKPIDPAALEEA